MEASGTISDPITFQTGGRFYLFENTVDKPLLISEIVGKTDGKGWENKGIVVIPGVIKIPHMGINDLRNIDLKAAGKIFNSGKCPLPGENRVEKQISCPNLF